MQAPGMPLRNAFALLPVRELAKIIGETLTQALQQDGVELNRERLAAIASDLYSDRPENILCDQKKRQIVLEFLPIEKARELARRLNIKHENIYESFEKFDFDHDKNAFTSLLKFFGGAIDSHEVSIHKPTSETVSPKYSLFPYQRDVVLRAAAALTSHPRKVLLHMPTGAGKTRTATHLVARHLLSSTDSTLIFWLANSRELLDQAAESLQQAWKALGDRPLAIHRFWGDYNLDLKNVKNGIVIASFAKLHALYKKNPNLLISMGDRTSLTVVDEAHQAIAPTYKSTIDALTTKRQENMLLGLTATPGRAWSTISEDEKLAQYFGASKVTLLANTSKDPVQFLIDEGYLAEAHFFRMQYTAKEGNANRSSEEEDFSESLLNDLGSDTERNHLILDKLMTLIQRHKRIIYFAPSVDSSDTISTLLKLKGVNSESITGKTPNGKRKRAIQQYKGDSEKPMILCNYGVLTTGFDAPKTSAAVVARPTKSLVLYSQMVGRATRGPKAGGNQKSEIWTVVDTNLTGFGSVSDAFHNWEDVWSEEHE